MTQKFKYYLLLWCTILACTNSATIHTDKPNIVIILADDQGWGDLSLNGNPIVNTPNIDSLAIDGTVLHNFYVNAVCSPTRAELLTGRYHVRAGVYSTSQGGERMDLDESTLAEAFKGSGYKTGAFGKWHNGMQASYHPNARGFDEFIGYCSGHWGSYMDAMLEHNGSIIQTKGYLTDVLTDQMINFISDNAKNPFLAYLPLNTPHSPMQVPDRWYEKFENQSLPSHRYSDRENADKTRAAYAMAENIDWNVGRVIQTLDSLGISDNTIVIYFSDNGPNGSRWNQNMKGQKGSTDEGGVRSPFIIKWPKKIPAGNQINTIAHVIDLYPTLAALTNIEPTNQLPFDGRSLATILLDKDQDVDDRILYSYWNGNLSVRNQGYRLGSQNKLYDMEKDRTQSTDVSMDFPGIHQTLKDAKSRWETEVLSELPKEDNRPFPIGHPDQLMTQLPARDARTTGNIVRSNRWPNCSFYTNWTTETDEIFWELEVMESGDFRPTIYYTCSKENIGVNIHLSDGNEHLSSARINTAFDPPLRGMEFDRIPRGESYVKDWKELEFDKIKLDKGSLRLSIKASNIKADQAIDFRLLTLERV